MMRRRTIAAAFLASTCTLIAIGCGGGGSAPAGNAPAGSAAGSASAGTAGGGQATAPASATATASASASVKIDTVVLITIDTLRADRVGAYGWRAARTPAIDALAARGVRAERAYATAPITLPSHASLMTGVYPSRHGARHNGMRMKASVPTLAEMLRARGFATGAFIAAFPLDRRFGLDRGFDVYGDTLPRGADGRPRNERSGQAVVDEALAWVAKASASGGTANASGASANTSGGQTDAAGARTAAAGGRPLFLWVHLFEPHAPYEADAAMGVGGHSVVGRGVSDRYDDEIARADRQVARIVDAFAARRASTAFIVTADHGEAFGEHGEVGHSLFVYDSTLRVPLILAGPGIDSGDRPYVDQRPVSLVDVAPTVIHLLGLPPVEMDGLSLLPLSAEQRGRELYAESFAPLLDFGWSPLRALRNGPYKYIAAPKSELYDLANDPAESHNLVASPERVNTVQTLAGRMKHFAYGDRVNTPEELKGKAAPVDREAVARLQSLGYVGAKADPAAVAAAEEAVNPWRGRPDPKDRVELAARIGQVTSGELHGPALRAALERIVRDDPKNGQMRMRLAFALQESGGCAAAVPHFEAAIAAAVPSADPHLGLAECLAATGRADAARRALVAADRLEPGNPIVSANLGLMALDAGRVPEAIDRLKTALARVPDLHEARFALVRAYARDGNRAAAAREAEELLKRMPADAPQRAEVARLLAVVR